MMKKCPKCGSTRVALILYGLPAFDEELERQLQNEELFLGGCKISGMEPQYHCFACNKDVGSPPILLSKRGMEDYRDIVTSVYFYDGGYFGGWNSITINKTKSGIYAECTTGYRRAPGGTERRELTEAEWEKLLNRLYCKLYVHEWKKEYSNNCVLDGEQWSLEFKLEGRRVRNYGGSNAFPAYWKELKRTFQPFFKEIHANTAPFIHIEVKYHRISKNIPNWVPYRIARRKTTFDYQEQLILDGPAESIEYICQADTGHTERHSYHVEGVSDLLSSLYPDSLSRIQGDPPDIIVDPTNTADYEITMTRESGKVCTVAGSFDKYGLPDDWEDFAESISGLMRNKCIGELLDSSLYGKVKRRQSDLIFCKVTFDDYGRSYTYLANTDDYEPGETVIVPVGSENRETVARIESIEYLQPEDAPFPIEKAKHILRKYTRGD